MSARVRVRSAGASHRSRWRSGVGGRRTAPVSMDTTLLAIVAVGILVLGAVAGFAWALDRQLRGGLLAQHTEAVAREDWVPLNELREYVPLAFLVAIDPTFLHRGPVGQGAEGSTLSQELARQVHRLDGTVGGQARQLVMGPLLEARLSEADLLELFLNRVYLGHDRDWPVHGIHHAAREWMGKPPQELTLGEAATLAGLLLPPRIVDPRARVGAVGIRRNEVLRQMLEAQVVEEAEYAAAMQEPLGIQPGPEFVPMTRPEGWDREPEVIRLPPEPLPEPEPGT